MIPSHSGGALRTWAFSVFVAASILAGPSGPGGRAAAADLSLVSRSYLLVQERDDGTGGKDRFTPFYEYVSGEAAGLGGTPVSFHFQGWGRLGEQELVDGSVAGDLGAAYLEYRHPTGNAEARLGRFFLVEGGAAEVIDGAHARGTFGPGIGLAAFAGKPVELTIGGVGTGRSIYGGRASFARAGIVEAGLTYLAEQGDFPKNDGSVDDREIVGGDLWALPLPTIELTGLMLYNLSTEGFARQRYAVRMAPFGGVDLSVGYEYYGYQDLFHPALNPAFRTTVAGFDNNDKVRVLFAMVDWELVEGLTLEGAARDIRHDKDDPGNAVRGEIGARYAIPQAKVLVGISVAGVTADRNEDEYGEFRAFVTATPADWRLSLDALTQRYNSEFSDAVGRKDAWQVVGAAGRQLLPNLHVAGDLTYTNSPRLHEDYAGLVRLTYTFAGSTGGTK